MQSNSYLLYIFYFQSHLELYKLINKKKRNYSRIGNSYSKLKELEKAIEYYEKSITKSKNIEIVKKKVKIEKILFEKNEMSIQNRLASSSGIFLDENDTVPSEQVTLEEISSINQMIELMSHLSPSSKLDLIDKRVESYKIDSYPTGCNIQKCKHKLEMDYQNTRMCKMWMKTIKLTELDFMSIIRRLGNNLSSTIDWYNNCTEPGDINKNYVSQKYNPRILHSFSNEIYKFIHFEPGTCHVAVGFTDLGIFHEFKIKEKLSLTKPLYWIGYEASAFSVAKTSIIATMMILAQPTDHILQVWYSSSWSFETLGSFRNAIQYLLDSNLILFLLYIIFCLFYFLI